MIPIGGLLGRIVNAILYAVVTLVVLLIIAVLVKTFSPEIAAIIDKFAYLIALLTGLVVFFLGSRNSNV